MPIVFETRDFEIIWGMFATKIKSKKTKRSRTLKGWEFDAWRIFHDELEKAGLPRCNTTEQDKLPEPITEAYIDFCNALVPGASDANYLGFYKIMTSDEYNIYSYTSEIINKVLHRPDGIKVNSTQKKTSPAIEESSRQTSSGNEYFDEIKDKKLLRKWKNGNQYEGEHQNNQMDGKGIFTWANGAQYVGEFKSDLRDGSGIFTWPDGRKYVGEFKKQLKNGQGIHIWPDGSKYEGEWDSGYRYGQGSYTWPDGTKFIGTFKLDQPHGEGVWILANGEKIMGDFEKTAKVYNLKLNEC